MMKSISAARFVMRILAVTRLICRRGLSFATKGPWRNRSVKGAFYSKSESLEGLVKMGRAPSFLEINREWAVMIIMLLNPAAQAGRSFLARLRLIKPGAQSSYIHKKRGVTSQEQFRQQ